jgi:hypothetical protein
MSNAKEILNRVYEIIMGQETKEPVKVDLAQVKTMDGQAVLEAEAFEIGNTGIYRNRRSKHTRSNG